jgi:hypothetical protein
MVVKRISSKERFGYSTWQVLVPAAGEEITGSHALWPAQVLTVRPRRNAGMANAGNGDSGAYFGMRAQPGHRALGYGFFVPFSIYPVISFEVLEQVMAASGVLGSFENIVV